MTNRTIFITGASSGIGQATARAAVESGWNVGLFARSTDKIRTLADDLGDHALALSGDVTDTASQSDALARLDKHFGSIDAVFANAGRGVDAGGAENGNLDEWQAVVDLNIMGLLKTIKLALPYLKSSRGHFVLTGSAAGRRHIPGSVYGASKWFVHGFGGNLAEEVKAWGGRCTIIAPGMVNTAFFDEPKPGKLEAEDVAAAVMHALDAPQRNDVREVFLMPSDVG